MENESVLAEAARYNDAEAEEHGLPFTAAAMGIDLTALTHIAEQRAIRAMLVKLERLEDLKRLTGSTHQQALRFTPEQQEEIALLQAMYIDGIAIGWKARELESSDA